MKTVSPNESKGEKNYIDKKCDLKTPFTWSLSSNRLICSMYM